MNLDKEYAGLFELVAWLKQFKAEQDAQQVHQPTLTVVPEPELEPEPLAVEVIPKPARAGLWYTSTEVELLQELHGAKVHVERIAYHMQRDVEGIKRKLRKLRSGDYS